MFAYAQGNLAALMPREDETPLEYWLSYSPVAPFFGVAWRFGTVRVPGRVVGGLQREAGMGERIALFARLSDKDGPAGVARQGLLGGLAVLDLAGGAEVGLGLLEGPGVHAAGECPAAAFHFHVVGAGHAGEGVDEHDHVGAGQRRCDPGDEGRGVDLQRRTEVPASERGQDHDLLVTACQIELLRRERTKKMRAEQLKASR